MKNIAINGLGRIGKLVVRRLFDVGLGENIIHLNDLNSDSKMHAHLLEFDTIHGKWGKNIRPESGKIIIDGIDLKFTSQQSKAEVNNGAIDILIDCTGTIKNSEEASHYFKSGIEEVLVSAPVKDENARNIVYGVNHQIYKGAEKLVFTAASGSTNCVAPIIKILHEEIGIEHGSFTTIHNVTNTQTIVDKPAKDLRRARSALNSLIPTTTGSATAV